MTRLFENSRIKSIGLENRAIRSATWAGVGDREGCVTPRALELYGELGRGGIGLIITGAQYVLSNGQQPPFMIGNHSDGQVEGLGLIADAVHAHGSKIVAQLVHCGSIANPALFKDGDELWGPSAVSDPATGNVPKEMSRDNIRTLVEAYAAAARRSREAGFDGVQLHGAHGYGINQFLSPRWNRRVDRYGGTLRNRYRFVGEALEAIRCRVGEDYPILIKLNLHDHVDDGAEPQEMLQVAKWLAADGIAAIEVSGGAAFSPKQKRPIRNNIASREDEAYFAYFAALVKENVRVPVITVGGIRSLETANGVLATGKADYAAMSRPFIREPHLINRWKSGDTAKATCTSCCRCYVAALEGDGIYCVQDRKQSQSGKNNLKVIARPAACTAEKLSTVGTGAAIRQENDSRKQPTSSTPQRRAL